MPGVKVRNNNVDAALRVFKRKCIEHIWDFKQREYYEKPSEKRRKAKQSGIARARKRRKENELKRDKF